MRFIRDNWFNLALLAFALIALYVIAFNPDISAVQRILLVSLLALPLHQYEEYALPGGVQWLSTGISTAKRTIIVRSPVTGIR